MTELKCPFCQQELRNCCAGVIYTCSKPDSCPHKQCYGSKELWQELIRTRKALEMTDTDLAIIVTNLDKVFPDMRLVFETIRSARKRIAEITALEQKDGK